MSAITFYELKSCDTCRKALKALAGREVTVVDVRADGVPATTLKRWATILGPEALINRKSATWRGLEAAARAQADTAEGALTLLVANPTLMKRPVIEVSGKVLVGWAADTRTALGV